MSIFDVSLICMDCHRVETKRPDYEKARSAEEDALKNGDGNFKGIDNIDYPYTNIANDPVDW